MQFRGLLIALVAALLLGGGIWYSKKVEKDKEGKPAPDAPPKVIALAEDQVKEVEVRKAGGEPLLVQLAGDGKWQITSPKPYNADTDSVKTMLSAVSSLSADRLIEEKAADFSQYGLQPPSVEVTFTTKDGKKSKLLLGDDTPTGGAVFARLDGDPRVFTLSSYTKTSLDKTANDIRDKRLMTFDQDKLTRVELNTKKTGGAAIEFGKNNQNEWQILKPQPYRADSLQVEELIRKIKGAQMDLSLSEEEAKKSAANFAGGALVAIAKATDASGTQQIEIRKNKDTYFAKSSVVEGIHKVGADLGDGLDKSVDDFRNKKLFDFGFTDVNKLELKGDGRQVTYVKSGDKWMNGPQQMDSTGVQSVIDKLRDLAAIKFPASGFTTPIFEATVVSNDNKRTEKVLISKSGNSYFAKRENEPSIYELDGKAVEDLMKASAEVKAHQADDKKKKDEQKK